MVTIRQESTDQAALSLEIDDDGVAWLTFDRPDSRVNLLDRAVIDRLDTALAELEDAVPAGQVRAVVVRSAKPDNFIAGADIEEFGAITDAADGEAKAAAVQRIFRRLELLPVPTVAAIDGTCLGGGLELALACAYRLAADRPETRLGLPEVRLGIIPGFGGTVRLPRLVGLQAALDLILTGRAVSASTACRLGLIDERVPAPLLVERARQFALHRAEEGRRRSGARRGVLQRLLDDTLPGRVILCSAAKRKVLAQTHGHYPAPLVALRVLRRTLALPLNEAFAEEARAVGGLLVSDECRNLVHVYRLVEGSKKAAPAAAPRSVDRVAVVGAGIMGGGIAQLLAFRGLDVRLKDIRPEPLSAGLRRAGELFARAVERRRLDRREAARAMVRIAPTLDYTGFGAVDLVVEAVVERMHVKRDVLREIETHCRPGTVLASNTSSLSISELQRVLDRPEDFGGMHFFNPVHRMPLIEIIRGDATSDDAIATLFALARRLGKTPLVVGDGPGFLVNRLLGPYLNEAGWLLAEGAGIEDVDKAMTRFGMPMGPFRLLDEVGLDVSRRVGEILFDAFGERMQPSPPLAAMAGTERVGRKGGAGFYTYRNGRAGPVDTSVYADLGNAVGNPGERSSPVAESEIQERLILVMVNEAARALEDGIIGRAADVDLGMITGTGFPPFRGGLLRHADRLGTPRLLERLELLESRVGERYRPAPLIRQLAGQGTGFYT